MLGRKRLFRRDVGGRAEISSFGEIEHGAEIHDRGATHHYEA
jgi:hypothetical protein